MEVVARSKLNPVVLITTLAELSRILTAKGGEQDRTRTRHFDSCKKKKKFVHQFANLSYGSQFKDYISAGSSEKSGRYQIKVQGNVSDRLLRNVGTRTRLTFKIMSQQVTLKRPTRYHIKEITLKKQ
jgi:hypothetical protein